MEESLDHRSKLRLMSQFMFGVGGYIVARIAAILLPLFFVNQPGQEDLAIRIVLILENVVLWAFLAALAYIFRFACPHYAPFSSTRSAQSAPFLEFSESDAVALFSKREESFRTESFF